MFMISFFKRRFFPNIFETSSLTTTTQYNQNMNIQDSTKLKIYDIDLTALGQTA